MSSTALPSVARRLLRRGWPLAAALLAVHIAFYGDWIVDDAAISFAYARSLATGHGFVAAPGDVPVEGFTNLLWTLLLAATMRVGAFDPVWTPKLLGWSFGVVALLQVARAANLGPPELRRGAAIGLAVTALDPAFAIWCASGLENSLLVALVATGVHRTLCACTRTMPRARDAVSIGSIAALAIATRPDAAVFAAGMPLMALTTTAWTRRQRMLVAVIATATTLFGVGVLTVWRWIYFGDVVPNTFHAKGDGTAAAAAKALALVAASWIAARLAWAPLSHRRRWLAATVASAAFLLLPGARLLGALGRGLGPTLQVAGYAGIAAGAPAATAAERALLLWLHLSMLQFFALPRDWMGEWRFGTVALLLAPTFVCASLLHLRALVPARVRSILPIVATTMLVWLAVDFARRAVAPRTVPFAEVAADQRRVVRWLARLGAPSPSLLAPDLGGRLWIGGCRIHDLAGLCDRRIARLLGRDATGLAELVFDELRPTLVELHGYYAERSQLGTDARLQRDYAAITAGVDVSPGAPQGWFVRRDALPDDATLDALRRMR